MTERISNSELLKAISSGARRSGGSGSDGPATKLIWGVLSAVAAAGILATVGMAIAQGRLDERIEDVEDDQRAAKPKLEEIVRVGQKFDDFERQYEKDQVRTQKSLDKILDKLE